MTEKSPRRIDKKQPEKESKKAALTEVCIFSNEEGSKRVFPPHAKSETGEKPSRPGKKEVRNKKHKDRLNRQLDKLPAVPVQDPLVKYKVVDPLDFFKVPPYVRKDPDTE